MNGAPLPKLTWLLLSLGMWSLAAACTVAVDTHALQKGCPVGTKPCEATPGELSCVSVTDPEYGCARESCVPCTLPHAVEVCGGDGECAVGTCIPEFQNCDRIAKTGCEVDLDTSYDNCGACGASCREALRAMPHVVSAQCSSQRCVVDECQDGYADCDGASTNGCEELLEPRLCGLCHGCPGTTKCNLDTQHCE